MTLLTVNAGSSSIRLAAYARGPQERRLLASHHGGADPAGAAAVLREFLAQNGLGNITAVAHRVVHGGEKLVRPCVIDTHVEQEIERLSAAAPLHNPPALAWLRACREVLGSVPQVAVFDTGFYAELPETARTYALPRALTEQYGLRRFGFHGLAHEAMWRRWRQLRPGVGQDGGRAISLQLGAGCSITAVRAGRALDTSMGFSPLEGLVMATRAGDVDPGLLLYLQRTAGLTPSQLEKLLNEESGLLGVSGRSADMRALLASQEPASRLAVELYCYRARKYLGAYLAALGGADAVLFGGGVGENAPEVRARILDGMAWAGVALDAAANREARGREARISRAEARVEVWVVPVDEAAILAEAAETALERDGVGRA